MVGTAAALLAAGCGSTGTTSTGATGAPSAGTTSSSAAAPPPNEAIVSGTPSRAASSAPSTTSTTSTTTVYGCDQTPVSQPKTYILSCGDGGVVLDRLAWSGWGQAKATATGVQIENSCVPSCAAGTPVSTKATVTLSGLTAGHYTKLHVMTAKGATDYTIDTHGPLAAG